MKAYTKDHMLSKYSSLLINDGDDDGNDGDDDVDGDGWRSAGYQYPPYLIEPALILLHLLVMVKVKKKKKKENKVKQVIN